ncbi:hypothetical protein NKH60_30155 [Mesorhizobium sp. M1006]|uniref:hypothetical protein n=1 Tax=Mesorhizobium sp. M1006 TaxID=2957048 RepID=UPI00333B7949
MKARKKLETGAPHIQARFLAVYGSKGWSKYVDMVLEECAFPRAFEWNLLHSWIMQKSLLDMDGVLCADPTKEENDDGRNYRLFIKNARRLALPSVSVRAVVTSRLERYRSETEEWLVARGVSFEKLIMLDVPSATERRKLNLHSSFKADVYRRDPGAMLFIESDPQQAAEIAGQSGKAVLDYQNKVIASPDAYRLATQYRQSINGIRTLGQKISYRLRRGAR